MLQVNRNNKGVGKFLGGTGMIVSFTYTCNVCGKSRTEKSEAAFGGVPPEKYICWDCSVLRKKIRRTELVSFLCSKCGKESMKKHIRFFKLVDHKWTCPECYALL